MPVAEDQAFRTLAAEETQSTLLEFVERFGARIAPGRTRITHVRAGALAVGAIPLAVLVVEVVASVIFYALSFVVTTGLITATGIGARVWLSRRVEEQKRLVLREVSDRIEGCLRELRAGPDRGVRHAERLITLKTYVDLHRAVDATATSYLNAATITQYAVTLAAVLVQFGVPVLVAGVRSAS